MAIPTPILLRRDILGVDPSTGDLKEGELGYAYASEKLFIGGPAAGSVLPIGGASFIALLTATPGVATADKAVILDSNTEIDVWTVVGQVEANTFKTSASVNAGFVKNNVSGQLLFGQTGEQTDLDLDNLADVTAPTPSLGEYLCFDGFGWVNAAIPLNDLSDVVLNTPTSGDFLRFTGAVFTNTLLSASDLPAHTHVEAAITDLQAYLLPTDSIDSLADVDTTTSAPIIGEHLQWDGSDWVPGPAAGLGAVTELDDLSDVTITTPAVDSLLQFDGSQWVDQADLVIDSGAATYWGPITANDTWRMIRSGNDISFQRRESNVYVEKAKFLPASFLTSGSCTAGSYVISGVSQVGFIKHDDSGNFIFEDLIQPGDLPASGYDLDDLGDVSVPTPGTGDHLEWNGSSWIAAVPGHTAPGASAFNDLSDVILTSPAIRNVLQYDGANWRNETDLALDSAAGYHLGSATVNDTWRIQRSGNNLAIARRISNSYEDVVRFKSGFDTSGIQFPVNNFPAFRDANNNRYLRFSQNNNAVNFFDMRNASTGFSPLLSSAGADANVDFTFNTRGTGLFVFGKPAFNTIQLRIDFETETPILRGFGSVDDVNLQFETQGIGKFIFQPGGGNPAAGLLGVDSNGELQFNQGAASETVSLTELSDVTLSGEAEGDFLRLNGSAEWVNTTIADGDVPDTLTLLQITVPNPVSSGTRFRDAANALMLIVRSNGSAIFGYLAIETGGPGGPDGPTLLAQGDTNMGLQFECAGTGKFKFNSSTSATGLLGLNSSDQLVFGQSVTDAEVPNILTLSQITIPNPIATGIKFKDAADDNILIVSSNGSAVFGYFRIETGGPGGPDGPRLFSTGDTNMGMQFVTNGSGKFKFKPGGTDAAAGLVGVDSSGNLLFNQGVSAETIALDELSDVTITAAASGDFLRFNGSAWVDATIVDADVPDTLTLNEIKTTTGSIQFTDTNSNTIFQLVQVSVAVNEIAIFNASTGNSPRFIGLGGDADVGLQFETKGSGTFVLLPGGSPASAGFLGTDGSGNIVFNDLIVDADVPNILTLNEIKTTTGSIQFTDTNSNTIFQLVQVGAAVNEIAIFSAATGDSPRFIVVGGDTDIGLQFEIKGAGRFRFHSPVENPALEIYHNSTSMTLSAVSPTGDANLRFETEGVGKFFFKPNQASPAAGILGVDSSGAVLFDQVGTIALGDLSDVVITTPATRAFLSYDGNDWVDATDRVRIERIVDSSNEILCRFQTGAGDLHFTMSSGTSGNHPKLLVGGVSEANVGMQLQTKGTGTFRFRPGGSDPSAGFVKNDSSGNLLFGEAGDGGASELNDLTDVTLSGEAEGDFLRKSGGDWVNTTIVDADVPEVLTLSEIQASNGNTVLTLFSVAGGAENFLEIRDGITSVDPRISAMGADANIGITLRTKGTGVFRLFTDGVAAGLLGVNANGDILFDQTTTLVDADIPDILTLTRINDTNGNEQVVFVTTGAAVNFFEITNAAAGGDPKLASAGDNTNVGLDFATKGIGTFKFLPGGGTPDAGLLGVDGSGNLLFNQGAASETVSLTELSDVTLSGEAEGDFLRLNGSAEWVNTTLVDADIPDILTLNRINDASGNELLILASVGSAVNYLVIPNSAAGQPIVTRVLGDDADVGWTFETKGSGLFRLQPGSVNPDAGLLSVDSSGNILFGVDLVDADIPDILTLTQIKDLNGNSQVVFSTSASAVNFLVIKNGATGIAPNIRSQGSDTDVGFTLETRNAGTFRFQPGGGNPSAGLLGVDGSGNLLFAQSGGASALNDLSDVTITSVATNDLLAHNGSVFVNVADITVDSVTIASGGNIQFSSGIKQILDAAGEQLLTFRQTGSGTNHFEIVNGGTGGGPPALEAAGSVDANIALRFQAKGTGDYEFIGASAAEVVFRTLSIGANSGMRFITKGTGVFSFLPDDTAPAAGLLGVDSSGNLLFNQPGGASALNDLSDVTLSGAAEGDFLRLNGSGQFVNTTLVDADIPANLDVTNLSAAGSGINFFDAFDNMMFEMDRGGSPAVNWFNTFNAVTGVNPVFTVKGSDTNIGIRFATKGSGTFQLFPGGVAGAAGPLGLDASGNITFDSLTLTDADIPNELTIRILTGTSATPSGADIQINDAIGNEVFDMKRSSAAVNYVRLWNANTGNNPFFEVLGDDTNIGFEFHTKGSGTFVLQPGGGNPAAGLLGVNSSGEILFNQGVSAETIALDELSDVTLTSPVTGSVLVKSASVWIDSTTLLTLAGNIQLSGNDLGIHDTDGNEVLLFVSNVAAVNYMRIFTSLTGADPALGVQGDDGNIGLRFAIKGTGVYTLQSDNTAAGLMKIGASDEILFAQSVTDAEVPNILTLTQIDELATINDPNGNEMLLFVTAGSAVNYLRMFNSATGVNPALSVQGDDADISLRFAAKGTGAIEVESDLQMTTSTDAFYFGPRLTNGTWRIVRDGDDLQIERRESNVYNSKGSFTP